MPMSATKQRHRAIRDLVDEQPVLNQGQLLELLAERQLAVTQPQLSRDLRVLGVVKQDGRYVLTERVTGLAALAMLLRGAQAAGANLVVVQCEPGSAGAVARALEAEELAGVVGTVAGDDTIFVAVQDQRAGDSVRALVETLIAV